MNTLISAMKDALVNSERISFRSKEAHYASGNLTCLRDQYWGMIGVPETNKTDAVGAMKMLLGNAVEKELISAVFYKMQQAGWNVLSTQTKVGEDSPHWHGLLDIFMSRKVGDELVKFVVEIKTKSGYGADLFYAKPEPSPEYMTQIGLYLRRLSKENINYGLFVYVLLSDKHFGTIISVSCAYDKKTDTVYASEYERSDGTSGTINVQLDLKKATKRWEILDQHIKDKTVPNPEYTYKYELTTEKLQSLSDAMLKKIIDGAAIGGDWQPLYSRYKDLQLSTDKINQERSPEEKALCKAEYRKRHPRSKMV